MLRAGPARVTSRAGSQRRGERGSDGSKETGDMPLVQALHMKPTALFNAAIPAHHGSKTNEFDRKCRRLQRQPGSGKVHAHWQTSGKKTSPRVSFLVKTTVSFLVIFSVPVQAWQAPPFQWQIPYPSASSSVAASWRSAKGRLSAAVGCGSAVDANIELAGNSGATHDYFVVCRENSVRFPDDAPQSTRLPRVSVHGKIGWRRVV